MKLYRVSFESEQDSSRGFCWVSSKREAEREAAEFCANDPEDHSADIECFEVVLSKRGVLLALNKYATHPDNG